MRKSQRDASPSVQPSLFDLPIFSDEYAEAMVTKEQRLRISPTGFRLTFNQTEDMVMLHRALTEDDNEEVAEWLITTTVDRISFAYAVYRKPRMVDACALLINRRNDAEEQEMWDSLQAYKKQRSAANETGRNLVQCAHSLGERIQWRVDKRTHVYRHIDEKYTPAELEDIYQTVRTDRRERRTYPTPLSQGSYLHDLITCERLLPESVCRRYTPFMKRQRRKKCIGEPNCNCCKQKE